MIKLELTTQSGTIYKVSHLGWVTRYSEGRVEELGLAVKVEGKRGESMRLTVVTAPALELEAVTWTTTPVVDVRHFTTLEEVMAA